MKNILYIFVVLAFISCKNTQEPEVVTFETTEATTEKQTIPENAPIAAATFEITGMTCAIGCAALIEKNIAKMDGVKSVHVDFESTTATVEYNTDTLDSEDIISTVSGSASGDIYKVTSWKEGE